MKLQWALLAAEFLLGSELPPSIEALKTCPFSAFEAELRSEDEIYEELTADFSQ
jgi:hypothetical protein